MTLPAIIDRAADQALQRPTTEPACLITQRALVIASLLRLPDMPSQDGR